MLFNELTIEQSDDFLLLDFLRKVKLIFGKGFQFWKLGLKDYSLQSALSTSRNLA